MKRLGIYAFYDQDGIVDEYVYYYLNALSKICSKIIFVVNGSLHLNVECEQRLLEMNVDLLIRENTGFDAFAYKFALDKYKNDLSAYDEIVLSNNSFFGPIYPLEDMFNEMEGRTNSDGNKLDFWGISIHPQVPGRIHATQEFNYINEHIQTFFVVFTKRIVESSYFENFWNSLNPATSFLEAVCTFELKLTSYFSQADFTYDSYVDYKYFGDVNGTILYPFDSVKYYKCPIVKRKIFSEDYQNFFYVGEGCSSRKTLEYIQNELDYDTSLIWKHLCRTTKMSELRMDLQLNYVLSSEFTKSSNIELAEKKKIALILYIYYEEAIDECLDFARNMPNSSDVFFISTKQEVLDKIKENCKNRCLEFSKATYTKKINKGRDLSSYLIDLKHVFDEYDYVCYFHDKKSPQLNSRLQTREFFYHCMNSLLPSSNFVYNIIQKFENEPNLGLLVPPPLHFGPFYPSEYNLHPSNKEWMLKLLKELKLNVPFDEFPVAPYGDMFWVRGKAMSSLFNKDWTYDDLPDEPIDVDGTILHALERMIPFVAQDKGYFTSWLCSEDSARTEISNFYYSEKTLKQELFNKFVFCRLDDMSRFIRSIHNENSSIENTAENKIKYSKIVLKKKIMKYILLNIVTFFVVAKFRRKLAYLKNI